MGDLHPDGFDQFPVDGHFLFTQRVDVFIIDGLVEVVVIRSGTDVVIHFHINDVLPTDFLFFQVVTVVGLEMHPTDNYFTFHWIFPLLLHILRSICGKDMAYPFKFHDYFNLDKKLDDEIRLARDTVRNWVDSEIMPVIEDHAMNATFSRDWLRQLGELGCYAPSLAVEDGGQGFSETGYGVLMRELERGDTAIRSMASVQGSLVMYPIASFGSDEQKARYLKELGSGALIGCFGLTEPDHGSDPGGMETRLTRDGDGFRLKGSKMWITNAPLADIAVIWAKNPDGKVQGLILDMKREGVRVESIKGKWSLRASSTGTIYMDDVRISSDELLPQAKGLGYALKCLNKARYGISWGVIGAAMDCYNTALSYALEREQFDRPIGGFQLTQKKLAEMITVIAQSQLMAWRLGELADRGEVTSAQISMTKRANVDSALRVAREARQILGAMGITNDYPVMRHMVNLETVITYEGTHDIHLLITGQDVTGIPAFK